MANKFLRVEYDKFTNKRVTSMMAGIILLKEGYSAKFHISLRHVSNPELEELHIALSYIKGDNFLALYRGEMIININDIENIVLEAHGVYQHGYSENCYYVINKEILKKICDAKSIDFQISGRRGKRMANGNIFIKYAQIFYNGFYDEELYKEVVENYDFFLNDDRDYELGEIGKTESGDSGNSCMVTLLIMCSALSSVAACLIFLIHYL